MSRADIAYLVSRFPSVSETFILREITELHAQGMPVEIFSLKRGRRDVVHGEARALLPHVYHTPPFSRKAFVALIRWTHRAPGRVFSLLADLFRWSWRNPRTLAKTLAVLPVCCHFASVMEGIRIRYLHAHMATFQATAALVISRVLGVPISFTGHASDLLGPFGREVHGRTALLDVKVAAARFIVTCSPDGRDFLTRAYPEFAHKVRLNYHGLDLDRFQPGHRPENQIPVILAVGSLLECKGYPDLIEACRLLRRRWICFRTLIVGEGPLRGTLEAQVKTTGLEGIVTFLGAMTQERLLGLYRVADLFVLPALTSSHFGIPNVLLEAMAMEIPVIVTDLPAIGELIDSSDTGVVVPHHDPETLASAIEALLADPERRRILGKKGRDRVAARFDIRVNVAELKEILLPAEDGRT